jgi:hypothetical protein
VQRPCAAHDAAHDFEPGASLAAIKAERHRFLNLESRLATLRVPTFLGGEDGGPLAADGE